MGWLKDAPRDAALFFLSFPTIEIRMARVPRERERERKRDDGGEGRYPEKKDARRVFVLFFAGGDGGRSREVEQVCGESQARAERVCGLEPVAVDDRGAEERVGRVTARKPAREAPETLHAVPGGVRGVKHDKVERAAKRLYGQNTQETHT